MIGDDEDHGGREEALIGDEDGEVENQQILEKLEQFHDPLALLSPTVEEVVDETSDPELENYLRRYCKPGYPKNTVKDVMEDIEEYEDIEYSVDIEKYADTLSKYVDRGRSSLEIVRKKCEKFY